MLLSFPELRSKRPAWIGNRADADAAHVRRMDKEARPVSQWDCGHAQRRLCRE
jgi:hypothetical protein